MRRMILPLLLLVVACQPASVEQQAVTTGPDVEAVKTTLDQAVAAFHAGDLEALLVHYADDAVTIAPNEPPIIGKVALRSAWQLPFAENTFQLTASPDEVVVAGDLAVMRLSWEETVTPKGGGEPTVMRGHWLIIWRKQSDGSWKDWREMLTVVPPPPPPAM